MKLSDYWNKNQVLVDNKFSTLGYVDSSIPGTLAYCNTEHHLLTAVSNPNITSVITRPDLGGRIDKDKGVVISDEPRNLFYTLHNLLVETRETYGLKLYSVGCGKNCSIHSSAIISENVTIGDHVSISENVVIKDGTSIGDNCFIDSGAIIGADGLLYYYNGNRPVRVKHAGGVMVSPHSSILAGAVIVKSVHEDALTRIGTHSIIGVQTNIGHEAIIGDNCVFSSNCVVARRVIVENNSFVGPSSTIREHVRIGANSRVRLGSVVVEDIEPGNSVSGNFAYDHSSRLRRFIKEKRNFKI